MIKPVLEITSSVVKQDLFIDHKQIVIVEVPKAFKIGDKVEVIIYRKEK